MNDIWPYHKNSSHVLVADKTRNILDPSYLSTATITLTLRDAATGIPVTGQTWPLTLPFVTTSDGRYRITVPAGLIVTLGQRLEAEIVIVSGTIQRQYTHQLQVV